MILLLTHTSAFNIRQLYQRPKGYTVIVSNRNLGTYARNFKLFGDAFAFVNFQQQQRITKA